MNGKRRVYFFNLLWGYFFNWLYHTLLPPTRSIAKNSAKITKIVPLSIPHIILSFKQQQKSSPLAVGCIEDMA
jgi:hypothetical protein